MQLRGARPSAALRGSTCRPGSVRPTQPRWKLPRPRAVPQQAQPPDEPAASSSSSSASSPLPPAEAVQQQRRQQQQQQQQQQAQPAAPPAGHQQRQQQAPPQRPRAQPKHARRQQPPPPSVAAAQQRQAAPPRWWAALGGAASAARRAPPSLAAFLLGGAGIAALLYGWACGSPLRRAQPYSFTITFAEASKLEAGTPVRMKGVQIGTVTAVSLTPWAVEAVAEVADAANIVPRGSRADINLLGLAADPWIDISPPPGCALKVEHGPHHPACGSDGLIVCNGGRVEGSQGGSTDFMMKFFLSQHDRTRVKAADTLYHSRQV